MESNVVSFRQILVIHKNYEGVVWEYANTLLQRPSNNVIDNTNYFKVWGILKSKFVEICSQFLNLQNLIGIIIMIL